MTKRTPSSNRDHDISGGGDRYEALLEVLEHEKTQAARAKQLEEAERQKRREQRGPYWPVAVLAVITAWLWLFPPGFLRLEPPPPQPIEQEEAALRFTMYVQAQRIKTFREETGRLPETLDEAGEPLPGMQYTRLHQELYQLTGATDRITLTYRSDLPLDEFVGSGAEVLDEARIR
ncbi:MAG: hypothetical protein R3314_05935 [Longimicrobiales bacterium]|nr:hypothetical protein [Longimicrobiales bacterium]